MPTTTKLTTIDLFSLAGVTGGCHKQQPQPIVNNNNNVVQAPPAAPAPPPQIIEAPRKPVSVAVDYQG